MLPPIHNIDGANFNQAGGPNDGNYNYPAQSNVQYAPGNVQPISYISDQPQPAQPGPGYIPYPSVGSMNDLRPYGGSNMGNSST
jgi:hypothetical protein